MSEKAMVAMDGFKFGADPELFVFNDDTNTPVPAEMFPGTKDEPFKVEGGAWQRDGFAAEFNIDPVSNFADFNKNFDRVLKEGNKFLPKGYSLRAISAVNFSPEVFDAAGDETKELGCMPDYDAWTGRINPPPQDLSNPTMRCAAGHLHIGWTEGASLADGQHILTCRDFVKQLDWYLGAWSCKMDTDPTRRRLYGKAGACRYKNYGVEYRVLSNFWVLDKDLRLQVWNRMQAAINDMRRNYLPDIYNSYGDVLVQSINDTDLHPIFNTNGLSYPIKSIVRDELVKKPRGKSILSNF